LFPSGTSRLADSGAFRFGNAVALSSRPVRVFRISVLLVLAKKTRDGIQGTGCIIAKPE
jgi:hypothetical protein